MSACLRVVACLLIAASTGALLALGPADEKTRLTFLAVGQGDCAVFQTAGHTLLIDVGPNVRGLDAGQRIIVPRLRQMGIDRIDLILLSHPDADHIGGLASVLRAFPVGSVAVSSVYRQYRPLNDHLVEAHAENVAWLGPEQQAQVGNFSVEVDCPEWHFGEPDNGGSEFVRITGEGASAVFTGDADIDTEVRMLGRHLWSSQILKLGHHGSRTASGSRWLQAVKPEWAVISCGPNNVYGHPNSGVLDRVTGMGIKVARTDKEGDIEFEVDERGFRRVRPTQY